MYYTLMITLFNRDVNFRSRVMLDSALSLLRLTAVFITLQAAFNPSVLTRTLGCGCWFR